jgi:hypothetical protein
MALEAGKGSVSHPGRSLLLGKTRCPLYRRLGGLQGRSGQVQKILPPPGFDPWTVQPVASCYIDYATQPTLFTRFQQNTLLRLYTCTHTLPFYIIVSLTCFGSGWAIIKDLQFKGLYTIYVYTFTLAGATRVSLHVQDTAIVDTDWQIQHWSHVYKY